MLWTRRKTSTRCVLFVLTEHIMLSWSRSLRIAQSKVFFFLSTQLSFFLSFRCEDVQAKYATRAYKLNIAQIRKLCKFFHIDIHGEDGKKPLNKDETVDKLLDFLGEPDGGLTSDPLSSSLSSKNETKKAVVKKTKAATKTPTVTAKKKPATATKAKASPKKPPAEDPFVALKKHTKGEKPSDKVLRQWAKAYVLCFDIDQATTKHAIMTASDKFGVNLAPHKAKIKDMLADEM